MSEPLRAAALGALRRSGEPWARRCLETGRLAVEPLDQAWESSHGTVRAMRVRLFVDAEALGHFDATPFVRDALEHALGVAFAARPGESMGELLVDFGRGSPSSGIGYRESTAREVRLTGEELGRACAVYLLARGDDGAAALVGRGRVVVAEGRPALVVAAADRERSSEASIARDALARLWGGS